MLLFIILSAADILSFLVLKDHFYRKSRPGFVISSVIHSAFSLWIWITFIRMVTWKGPFDSPENVSNHMMMTGLICAVTMNRGLIIFTHYFGKLFRLKQKSHIRLLTNIGFGSAALYFTILALSFLTRFNYKTEELTLKINDLDDEFEGLRVVQISDLHLGGFHSRPDKVTELIELVNSLKPDIIINSGDFVSYGWRELEGYDSILNRAGSTYGNFAVLGNHDIGTYIPGQTESGIKENLARMNELIRSSGYTLLDNSHTEIRIGTKVISVIGVSTGGRYPGITHGSIRKAMQGLDSADLMIAICHDPDQWEEEITGATNIDLTFSGHTHGMQLGIITGFFRWSIAKYIYPHWNGLYKQGDQWQYVNRGAGLLAMPFRIWMPPEITVITLENG
jgi:predicted MPP superfamily phosphohydrolase